MSTVYLSLQCLPGAHPTCCFNICAAKKASSSAKFSNKISGVGRILLNFLWDMVYSRVWIFAAFDFSTVGPAEIPLCYLDQARGSVFLPEATLGPTPCHVHNLHHMPYNHCHLQASPGTAAKETQARQGPAVWGRLHPASMCRLGVWQMFIWSRISN